MDQHLKPTIILLILLFFGALLGAKFWAGHQALLLPVSVLIIAGTDAWVPEATALMAALALMVALFYGLYRWLAGMRIGVLGDFLILRDWRGRHTVGKGARIGYSDQHLMIGGLILPLALQNQSLFPKEALVQRVYPIMRQGNFIPRGQAQLLLMKNSPWVTVALVFFTRTGTSCSSASPWSMCCSTASSTIASPSASTGLLCVCPMPIRPPALHTLLGKDLPETMTKPQAPKPERLLSPTYLLLQQSIRLALPFPNTDPLPDPIALAALPYERYCDSDNIVVRLNLPNMFHTPGQRVEVYARAVRGLTDLEADPEKRLKYWILSTSTQGLTTMSWRATTATTPRRPTS